MLLYILYLHCIVNCNVKVLICHITTKFIWSQLTRRISWDQAFSFFLRIFDENKAYSKIPRAKKFLFYCYSEYILIIATMLSNCHYSVLPAIVYSDNWFRPYFILTIVHSQELSKQFEPVIISRRTCTMALDTEEVIFHFILNQLAF